MLYPYRPSSVKNRQRWNFGVVYPRAYSESQKGSDAWLMQTECLATSRAAAELNIRVRFLQAVARTIGALKKPLTEWPAASENDRMRELTMVESLEVGGKTLQTWQEAVEREFVVPSIHFPGADSSPRSLAFSFPGGREFEPVRGEDGRVVGVIVRTSEPIEAKVEVSADFVCDRLTKVSVRILNISAFDANDAGSREEALMRSLLSAHTILHIDGGEYVSHIDPPAALKSEVAACNNIGTWPVLAGEEGHRDCMLSSPIILYDYPQVAPESPGDLFDGTEIDEILALRILTLTEDEKHEMRGSDERSRQILERTEAMPAEHFMKLHGVLRGLRPADEDKR
jgi:hypothetical protein